MSESELLKVKLLDSHPQGSAKRYDLGESAVQVKFQLRIDSYVACLGEPR